MEQWQAVPLWEDDVSTVETTPVRPPRWVDAVGVFDLETTGIDVTTDRIVTAHVGLLDADGAAVRAQSWLADPGVPIPDGATAVHGITTAHAQEHGAPAAQVVAAVDELHTRQIGWARAQADSLTEYFIRIGRLDPEDRVDGSWPIR